MTVYAHCQDCDDTHDVGDRLPSPETAASTTCPVCGSTSYRSDPDGGVVEKSEARRISDAVDPVYGVGDDNRQALVEHFDVYAALEQASVEELTEVEGVGEQTAENIRERLEGDS